ncbi:hypothetical protein [Rufibacter aurantiacus]|uniref:hypothetical protein n=1 Tax=Rufibacter aurantiacus TaxID=2817374 RepID=UPI001B314F60|nr:hypothetical protein [Rufibacter aurantiacus]
MVSAFTIPVLIFLLAVFVYQIILLISGPNTDVDSKSKPNTEVNKNIEKNKGGKQMLQQAMLKPIRQSIEEGLSLIILNCNQGNLEEEKKCLIKSALEPQLPLVVKQGSAIFEKCIEEDKVQSFLIQKGEQAIYFLAIPILGDRPHLLRQIEGFSNGLASHINQIFSQLQSGDKNTTLLMVAFFKDTGLNGNIIYVGFRNSEEFLLPQSLISSIEASRFSLKTTNIRQSI